MRYLLLLLLSATIGFAKLTTGIEYASPGGESLKLDAFVPDGDGPFAACILVHGGGWTRGTRTSFITPLFEPLGKAGFAWFSIDYRLAPAHKIPTCAEDVETAIRWVKAHAQEYHVDPKRIALIGESAGGHLVSLVGARAKPDADTRVAAVVPFYAPHDLLFQKIAPGRLDDLFGFKELNPAAEQVLRELSATSYVRKDLPPYLLIHGDQDTTVPFEQSTRFQKMVRDAGATCDLIAIPGGAHGMGGWAKLNSDYTTQLVTWLRKTL